MACTTGMFLYFYKNGGLPSEDDPPTITGQLSMKQRPDLHGSGCWFHATFESYSYSE